MAEIPTPRSYQQILGDMIDAFRSKEGVPGLTKGGPLLSVFEAVAQSSLRGSQDVFNLLNAISIDKATGLALERIGADENVPRLQESPASGVVTISDSSFTKISSKLFHGSAAPIVGSVSINVVDASTWPASGQLYIGRGTPNYEGPLSYTSKTNAGNYWTLNLSAGTVRFHNVSETAILAQGGNRNIGPGIVVRTPQANSSDAVEFRTLYPSLIADGETEIVGVQVQAQKPGTIGNVAKGAVREFSTAPFSGATVTNPSPFSNGNETESDDDYRERIKNTRSSRALGTPLAITTAVTGITSPDENKRISSASIVNRLGGASTLYIDDGSGYEENVSGSAIESLSDSALGGEQFFQLNHRPVARAFAITENSSPFPLSIGASLSVNVGGVNYVHTFEADSFSSITNASAFEVASSINDNVSLPFLARTAGGGTQVVLFAKVDKNEDIEVLPYSGADANVVLGFSSGNNYTMRLYKNDRLLVKDGLVARYFSQSFPTWNTVTTSATLIVSVDNTSAVTYTFVDQDFIDAGTGYTTLGRNSIAAWAAVMNAKIPGITASESGGKLVLQSNREASGTAAIKITGGTLVAAKFFNVGSVQGASADYSLDRNLGQIKLKTVLLAGDRLSAGSLNTRSFLESTDFSALTTASTAKFWFVVDGGAQLISHGVVPSTTFNIAPNALHEFGHTLQISATVATPFTNVQAGDWVIIWDSGANASLQGAFRVVSATSANIVIERRLAPAMRTGHRSCALVPSGADTSRVLTTGGSFSRISDFSAIPLGALNSAEVYDPNTLLSAPVGSMNYPRTHHTLTLLPSGKVLAAGGYNHLGVPQNTMEIYDDGTKTWTVSNATLPVAVARHQAVSNGSLIVLMGGVNSVGAAVANTCTYNYLTDTVSVSGTMNVARISHRAVLLPSGSIFVVGGYSNPTTPLASTELWTAGVWSSKASMTTGRDSFGLAVSGTAGAVVVAVGARQGKSGAGTYQVYTIGSNTWGTETTLPSTFGTLIESNGAVQLSNFDVVVPMALSIGNGLQVCVFDHTAQTWSFKNGDPLADLFSKFEVQSILLSSGNIACIGGCGAYSNNGSGIFTPLANIEEYNPTGDSWTVPDPAKATGVTLPSAGIAFVRTSGVVHEADVAAASNYTASTVIGVLNPSLKGASASVYRTNRVRVGTNSYGANGDIALVAQNTVAAGFGLKTSSAVVNIVGSHTGSIESGNSELGTPSFHSLRVRAAINDTNSQIAVNGTSLPVDYKVVGLHDSWVGSDGTAGGYNYGGLNFYARQGSNFGFSTSLSSLVDNGSWTQFNCRTLPVQQWSPFDRMYLASPYKFGANDTLSVQVDGDVGKNYTSKMSRTLTTIGNVYSSTNSFKDGDASSVSLAMTFGLGFDFNDFAVYMPARQIAYPLDSSRSSLFRYYRQGPDGNGIQVGFSNPLAANSSLSVGTSYDSNTTLTYVRVYLKSGAARTPTVRTTTRVGYTCTSIDGGNEGVLVYVLNLVISLASRTSNVTTLTLSLPSGVTNHGFNVGDNVWVNSNNISFSSGLKTLTATSSTTISYAETASDVGSSAISNSTVSADTLGEATFSGGGVITGDFLRIDNTNFNEGSFGSFAGNTVSITGVAVAGGYVTTLSGELSGAANFTPSGTLSWTLIGAPSDLWVFANANQTAAQIKTDLNALAALPNPTCPVTLTTLGSGTGTITQCTQESLDTGDFWYTLVDGVNWVQTTTSPGSTAGDYSLTFKNAVSSSLGTNPDWNHETAKLVPTTAKNVIDWLNSPAVSGLFSSCSIQASTDGSKVQIATRTPGDQGSVQVQGGLANATSAAVVGTPINLGYNSVSLVKTADAAGLGAGQWCSIQNSLPMIKPTAFGSGMSLVSWKADGTIRFSSPIIVASVSQTQARFRIERQGSLMAIVDMNLNGTSTTPFGNVLVGQYIRLTPATAPTSNFPQISTVNQGIFTVLRVSSGTVWIDNPLGVDESAECNYSVWNRTSIMPGDQFIVSTPLLGAANQGTWVVESVGSTSGTSTDYFTNTDRFKVSLASRNVVAQGASAAFGSNFTLLRTVEGAPSKFIMQIVDISPNAANGAFTNLKWDLGIGYSSISGMAGSVVSVIDKLAFPANVVSGVNGYSFDVGLIGEANRVVYGDPSDSSVYPGVAAAGASINIEGPVVKRIQVSLLLRVKTGVSNTDVADRVKSAVATTINQIGIGEPIALSSIVSAAMKVVGVVAVTVLSPEYNAGNDLVNVLPFQKPLVLNVDQDVQISFVAT